MDSDRTTRPAPTGVRSAAAMVLSAAALWGLSGTAGQFLMQRGGVTAAWLATTRMVVAGVLLLALAFARDRRALLAPWRTVGDAARLVAFGALGLFLVQYSYLAAIAAANASVATVLQYAGSGLVVLWGALSAGRLPPWRQGAALALAAVGIVLLATDGDPAHLTVPPAGLAWGVVSAVTLAVYTIVPQTLLRRFGTLPVVGWGMLIGAACAAASLRPDLAAPAAFRAGNVPLVAFVLILGTCVPFTLYLASTRRLATGDAALLANAEPVAATLAAVLWLHIRLGLLEALGAALILAATSHLVRVVAAGDRRPDAGGKEALARPAP